MISGLGTVFGTWVSLKPFRVTRIGFIYATLQASNPKEGEHLTQLLMKPTIPQQAPRLGTTKHKQYHSSSIDVMSSHA